MDDIQELDASFLGNVTLIGEPVPAGSDTNSSEQVTDNEEEEAELEEEEEQEDELYEVGKFILSLSFTVPSDETILTCIMQQMAPSTTRAWEVPKWSSFVCHIKSSQTYLQNHTCRPVIVK